MQGLTLKAGRTVTMVKVRYERRADVYEIAGLRASTGMPKIMCFDFGL